MRGGQRSCEILMNPAVIQGKANLVSESESERHGDHRTAAGHQTPSGARQQPLEWTDKSGRIRSGGSHGGAQSRSPKYPHVSPMPVR